MKSEYIVDGLIVLTLLLPATVLIVSNYICTDAGPMHVECVIPGIAPIVDFVGGWTLLISFGGILLYGPIILVCYILSTIDKIRSIHQNGTEAIKNNIFGAVTWSLTTLLFLYVFSIFSSTY